MRPINRYVSATCPQKPYFFFSAKNVCRDLFPPLLIPFEVLVYSSERAMLLYPGSSGVTNVVDLSTGTLSKTTNITYLAKKKKKIGCLL
jgi:hypothetical protein